MKQISVTTFKEILEQSPKAPNTMCIDVRTEAEYRDGHIEGVINMPLSSLPSQVGAFSDAKVVYVQCLSGGRSIQAIFALSSLGVQSDLINVDGGIMAWNRAGFKVVT